MTSYAPSLPASIPALAADQELLYLAALTVAGVKPLSRYERPLSLAQKDALRDYGLMVADVVRPTAWGHVCTHTIFTLEFERLAAYLVEFNHTPLRYDAQGVLREGLHLGYPACCVTHFVTHGFQPNGLARRDQTILFHWACPNCPETAALLPRYRALWLQTQALVNAKGKGRPWLPEKVYSGEVF